MSTSYYLFARPSGMTGFAQSIDLFGTFNHFNESPNGHTADARAIRADWIAVGDDIREAALAWAYEHGFDKNDLGGQ